MTVGGKERINSIIIFHLFTQCDNENVVDGTSSSQTLLFVHQEPWQQELLRRYGNKMTLMDATSRQQGDNNVRTGFIFCNSEDECWI